MGKIMDCIGIAILGFVAGHIYGDQVFFGLADLEKKLKTKKEAEKKPEMAPAQEEQKKYA